MDNKSNRKKEFTAQNIDLPIKQRLALVERLKRRNLGVYKMGTYVSVRGGKTITNIASILHFNIDECLKHSTLKNSDKELIKCLR